MNGVIDIYMADFKFWDPARARRYLLAPDYPEAARQSIKEMHRQAGPLIHDGDGVAIRGLPLRHLVMPNDICGTRDIMRWVARELGTAASNRWQDTPASRVLRSEAGWGPYC
jgi:putative pyruvate formate lyase activating enzyme